MDSAVSRPKRCPLKSCGCFLGHVMVKLPTPTILHRKGANARIAAVGDGSIGPEGVGLIGGGEGICC